DKILMADGFIELEVEKIKNQKIYSKVIQGGILKERKGINIPLNLDMDTITDKDKDDIKFGLEHSVDYIGLSFVKSAADIDKLRDIIADFKRENENITQTPGIISKIERPEAIKKENLENIIKNSDGIMIARGDLGVELPLEKVPNIQNKIIRYCKRLSKPVIIATQMLYTMTTATRPTRAEVADIYNSILSGADCLMLSDETAIGSHPIKTIETFDKIIREAEKDISKISQQQPINDYQRKDIAHAVADAACQLATVVNAKAIISFTMSGFTALLISKNKPSIDILAITPQESVVKRLALYWGVDAELESGVKDTDEIISTSERVVLRRNMAKNGDTIVITAGIPIPFTGITNLIKVHKIKSE
ncbi:MAG: pyruvate kinase, partial [Candidatus Lokiarchaeota archaeon]|nr:pyruvate kinase [Candidatus Lokiarchaeota archaeon]